MEPPSPGPAPKKSSRSGHASSRGSGRSRSRSSSGSGGRSSSREKGSSALAGKPPVVSDETLFFLRPRRSSGKSRGSRTTPAADDATTTSAAAGPRGARPSRRTPAAAPSRVRRLALAFVVLWFAASGLGHFMLTDMEVRSLPGWVPLPRAMVLGNGVVELLGAAGLLSGRTRRVAGWTLFVLTILVTPAHYYVLENAVLSDLPYWMLAARLPMHALLLVLLYWIMSRTGRRRRGYRRV